VTRRKATRPLDDPRWVSLSVPHGWLVQRGDNESADHDLTALLRTRVPSMVRLWPGDERKQLPFSYWDEGEHYVSSYSGKVRVYPARPFPVGPKGPIAEDVYFAWGPELEEFRPPPKTAAAVSATVPDDEPQRRTPGPQPALAWRTALARELIRRALAGEPIPTAEKLCELIQDKSGKPDRRTVQKEMKKLLP
jgi:hypothetical protein